MLGFKVFCDNISIPCKMQKASEHCIVCHLVKINQHLMTLFWVNIIKILILLIDLTSLV